MGGDDGTRTHDPLLAKYPGLNGVLTRTYAATLGPVCEQLSGIELAHDRLAGHALIQPCSMELFDRPNRRLNSSTACASVNEAT